MWSWEYQMQKLKKQGKLGPRNEDQSNQQTLSFHAEKYQRWVQPSQTPFAIQRRDLSCEQVNDPVFGKCYTFSTEPKYKTIHRKNNKEFNIRYTSGLNSELWDYCPHCHRKLRKSIPLECEFCGGTVSFMLEYIQQPNFGKTKIAPHVVGCLNCPPRTDNVLLCLELNQDQLCLNCFDKLN